MPGAKGERKIKIMSDRKKRIEKAKEKYKKCHICNTYQHYFTVCPKCLKEGRVDKNGNRLE